jgi:hypothetical protein
MHVVGPAALDQLVLYRSPKPDFVNDVGVTYISLYTEMKLPRTSRWNSVNFIGLGDLLIVCLSEERD